MAELREHVYHLQQENDRLQTDLESSRPENPKGVAQNEPLARANKGKKPVLPDHSDHRDDDKLSSNSSLLPRHSPPLSNAEAESRNRPPCQSSRAMSGTRRRIRKEDNRPRSQLAPEQMATQLGELPLHFYMHDIHPGRSPSRMQPSIPLSRDPTTCCPPLWASIF